MSKLTLNRRTILAAGTTTAMAAIPMASVGATTCDRVFAAIEKHRQALAAFKLATHVQGALYCSDPKHDAAEKESNDASDVMDEVAIELLNTEPSSIAGVIALLRYIVDRIDEFDGCIETSFPQCLPDGVDPDKAKWNSGRSTEYFVMKTVAHALTRLAV